MSPLEHLLLCGLLVIEHCTNGSNNILYVWFISCSAVTSEFRYYHEYFFQMSYISLSTPSQLVSVLCLISWTFDWQTLLSNNVTIHFQPLNIKEGFELPSEKTAIFLNTVPSDAMFVPTAMKIQVEAFWIVTPCAVVVGYQSFGGLCYLHLQGQHVPPKRWYPSTTLYGATTQKTKNFNFFRSCP